MPPARRTEPASPSAGVRFGANHVPSNGWFYSWLDLSLDDVRRDFEDLASLGLDHVRIFPVWPWVQPNRGLVRQSAVEDVLATVEVAAEVGLDVAVDLVQGHLSSFDFLPSWVLTWHGRSVFADPAVRDGLRDYVSTMTRALAEHPNVFAVTLGNEVNNLWPSNDTDSATSTAWARELAEAVRAHAREDQLLVHSLFDDAFYAADHPFTPADVTELGDVSSVHSWVFNGVARGEAPLSAAVVTHADYLVELAAATASDPARPVWLQEVGAPLPEVPPEDAAAFVHETVGALSHHEQLTGVTWWCSHDLSRDLLDFPEREYELGLFTTDHRPKPAALALAEVVRAARQASGAAAAGRPALACPVDLLTDPQRRAEVAPGSDFHREWVRQRAAGPLAIVPASRAADENRLRARGITEVLGRGGATAPG